LQIPVHGHHHLALGIVETCRHGRGLAEVAPEAHPHHPGVFSRGLLHKAEGGIHGAVVHIDDLPVDPHGLARLEYLPVKGLEVIFFVV
jgi:hypothetical protein